MNRLFIFPIAITVVTLAAVYLWGGLQAFILAAILSVLEVTLSFDNAVVNAKVLKRMDEKWQRRFLTWGILLAVFGTRLVLPILIVSVVVWLTPFAVLSLVINDSVRYAELLDQVHPAISAFGGAFLLMVALKYFFDEAKEIHWIRAIEKRLAGWGRIEAVEIGLALGLLVILASVSSTPAAILTAGIVGIILFIFVEGLANSLGSGTALVAGSGLSLFLYLNVLDSAFSLDGVIGAFALTTQLPIIVAGLGIGAYFVRTMTVYLVRNKTLDNLIYLEHGAHWAILGLAVSMFAGLIVHVPEIVIGSIGLFFVLLAYISSRRERARSV